MKVEKEVSLKKYEFAKKITETFEANRLKYKISLVNDT